MELIRLTNDEVNEGLKLLLELVSIESTSPGGEKYGEIIDILREFYLRNGLPYEIITVPRDYQRSKCPHVGDSPRYIFRGTLGDRYSENWLHFNGHYDVVPGGPGWTVTEPFKPIVIDNKVYGRGATDMKGGLTSMTLAMLALSKYNEKMEFFLDSVYVPDEEVGGACGTGFLIEKMNDKLPKFGVIAEPSTINNIYIGHKGGVWARVKVRGKTAHASTPWLGDNAFMNGVKIAYWLDQNYVKSLTLRKSAYAYDEPNGNTPTALIGGEAKVPDGKSNQVPGEFIFSIDRRAIIEEDIEDVERELKQVISEASNVFGLGGKVDVEIISKVKPAFVPPDNPLSRSIKATAVELGMKEPSDVVCVGGLDLRYYLAKGVTAVSYGPGEPGVAHAPNEYIRLDDVIKVAEIFANLPFKLFNYKS